MALSSCSLVLNRCPAALYVDFFGSKCGLVLLRVCCGLNAGNYYLLLPGLYSTLGAPSIVITSFMKLCFFVSAGADVLSAVIAGCFWRPVYILLCGCINFHREVTPCTHLSYEPLKNLPPAESIVLTNPRS